MNHANFNRSSLLFDNQLKVLGLVVIIMIFVWGVFCGMRYLVFPLGWANVKVFSFMNLAINFLGSEVLSYGSLST